MKGLMLKLSTNISKNRYGSQLKLHVPLRVRHSTAMILKHWAMALNLGCQRHLVGSKKLSVLHL